MEENKQDIKTSVPMKETEPNEAIQIIFPKLEIVLETMKSKFDASTPNLFIKHSDFNPTFKTITSLMCKSENPTTDKYMSIIDCLNFISATSIDPKLISTLINCLSPKGTLFLVLNLNSINQLHSVLKEALPKEYNTNLFIKLYILDPTPFYGLLSIQTMGESKTPIDIDALKLLIYEVLADNTLSKPMSLTLNVVAKLCGNMSRFYFKAKEFSTLSPKRIAHVPLYENYFSDNVEFSLIIIDYDEEPNKQKGMCVIVVNKAYMADIIFLSPAGITQMCKQTNASRVILIRAAPFNYDSTQEMKQKIYSYIMLFKFKDCLNENISIRLMSDDKSEQYKVIQDKDYHIRDLVINENKETYRQLFASKYNEEVLYQERLILTSKSKAKQDPSYIQLTTVDKFAQKNLVSCFDDRKVLSYFVNAVLSSVLFLDIEFYPKTPFHVLVLGGGIGMVSYYLNKMLKGKVEITIVEPNQDLIKIGKCYFGMNDYDSRDKDSDSNIKWRFDSLGQYIRNMKEKSYYDMIIVDYWRGDALKGTIPPDELFIIENLNQVYQALNPKGIFIFNLLCRGFMHFFQAFESLEKTFPLMYSLFNNEPLDKIFFCFKTKMSNEDYKNNYKKNLPKLKNREIADITVILEEHEKVLSKVEDMENIRVTINSQIF